MPNRIIKESICYSEDIEKLNAAEEVFFYRLIVNCDDYGRMDARLPILKARLYPLKDNMKSSDIKRYLMKLADIKPEPLIILYKKNGIEYLQMVKWEKHQQIRAQRSKYPSLKDADKNLISDDINRNHMIAYVPENPNPNPNPIRESESEYGQKYEKISYADNVKMTITEYEKLITEYGETNTNRMIQILDNYKGSKGKTYKDDYRAILSWVVDRLKEEQTKQTPQQKKNTRFADYAQREYDDKELENFFSNGGGEK